MIFNRKPNILLFSAALVCFASCVVVKNPPKEPFVFDNEIILQGNLSKDEKKRLQSDLNGYWDDSVKAKRIMQFGVRTTIKNPQKFDTTNLERSKVFMNSYLNSQGYYNAILKDSFYVDTALKGNANQQWRVTAVMIIDPAKRLTIDSFAFDFNDTLLQKFTEQKKSESFLKTGTPFTKQLIGSEIDRLVAWYRENGYYRITREDLVAHVDTTEGLFDTIYLDPAQLATKVAEAIERKKQNPAADVIIKLARQVKELPFDTGRYRQYYVGDIIYYPETNDLKDIPDSLIHRNDFFVQRDKEYVMKYRKGLFVLKPIKRHTYLSKGQLYKESRFIRTYNSLAQIPAWRSIDSRDSMNADTVNFHLFLSPDEKYSIQTDFEITRNSGDFVASTRFFGLGANVTLLNRNIWRKAIQGSFSALNGVELNLDEGQLLQTIQSSLGISFAFPSNLYVRQGEKNESHRTLLNFNAGYTDRRDFFRLRSLTSSLGEEYKRGTDVWNIRFPNIELYALDTLPQLRQAFEKNPFLRSAFNTGNVISGIASVNRSWNGRQNPHHNQSVRVGLELAPLGAFKQLQNNFYGFAKLEGEYKRIIPLRKSEWAFRQFAGIGYNFSNHPVNGKTLPFFKQFVAGGPNSMRAWNLRRLGLGSSLLSDTATGFTDRFGDLQIETNIEYRFRVATIAGYSWNSALFFDIGNLWNIKNDPNNPAGTFRFHTFLNDIAVAAGISIIRMDFSFLLIRVDFALKLRDPARKANNGWLDFSDFEWRNKEYPNAGNQIRNNYAIQIGIGMPF